VNVQLQASAILPSGKDIPGTHLMRLDGTHSYSGRFGEAKDLTPLPEIEQRFLGCPV